MADPVPFEARHAMQKALWERCIEPRRNEWTTWTDAIILAEAAATALLEAGYEVRRIDGAEGPAGSTIAGSQPLGNAGQLSGLDPDDRTQGPSSVEGHIDGTIDGINE